MHNGTLPRSKYLKGACGSVRISGNDRPSSRTNLPCKHLSTTVHIDLILMVNSHHEYARGLGEIFLEPFFGKQMCSRGCMIARQGIDLRFLLMLNGFVGALLGRSRGLGEPLS